MDERRGGDWSSYIPAVGLALGPLLGVLVYVLLPAEQRNEAGALVGGLTHGGRLTLAVGTWLAVWWMTEAVAIEAAALLPVAVFPLAGVASFKATAAPYADEVVFLFLGGMLMGSAMERWGLHTRLALRVMLAFGTRPSALVGGLLCSTAILSMWVSNTAGAIMMLPIARGVVSLAHDRHEALGHSRQDAVARHFGIACMLAVAYGASIGGVGMLIGSPPNGVFAGFMSSHLGTQVTFWRWALVGLPMVVLVLPLAWGVLMVALPVKGLRVEGARALLKERLRALGPMERPQWLVVGVCCLACTGWVLRVPIAELAGLTSRAADGRLTVLLTDAGVAVGAALLLFVLPAGGGKEGRGARLMDWGTASSIPWGVLLLFGGGLSLAAAIEAHGVDRFLGQAMSGLAGYHPLLVLLAVTALAAFLSEVGSNTAVATVMMPIVATLAPVTGMPAYTLCLAAALGSSLAFMLPSGTPPNALAFASGHLRMKDMVRVGLWMNLVCILVITIAVYWLVPLLGVAD
ncbi:MAG: SLC13 family permease [Phycisphaerales bacterium]|nr:SLC13 family permease [Phycisphaerales bacterium]